LTAPQSGNDHYQDARWHLSSLCLGREVVAYCKEQTTDGRLLAIVKLDDLFLNEKMLLDGYAAASGEVKEEKLKEKYATIAADAKNKSEGLWGDGWAPTK